MLFQVPPTPKQLEKLSPANASDFPVPENWADFARTLTIKSGKGFKKFDPFPMQLELSDLVNAHSFSMFAKSRQLGMSEFCLSKILHWALETPGYSAVVISRIHLDAYKLGYRMIQLIDSINLPTIRKSAAEIVLYNGSRIVFCQPGDSAARGEASVSCVMLDEFSYLREPELTLSAALPSGAMLGDDLKVIIIFTPNGKSNYAFKMLNERNPSGFELLERIELVRDGTLPGLHHWIDEDGWLKVLLHWKAHPIYSQKTDYLEHVAKTQKLPWKKVLREYDLSFEQGELQYIPDEDVIECAIGDFEEPEPNARYFGGLDTSSVGKDYFCFALLKDCESHLSLVHLYRRRRRSMKRHLTRIGAICMEYGVEAATVETNSFGQLYFEQLSQDCDWVAWQRFTASQRTNVEVMEQMLMKLEERTLIYPFDSDVIRELRGLEEDPLTGKIEAGKGLNDSEDDELHDDIPRSIALAVHCFEHAPHKSRIDISKIQVQKHEHSKI